MGALGYSLYGMYTGASDTVIGAVATYAIPGITKYIAYAGIPELPNGAYTVYDIDFKVSVSEYNGVVTEYHRIFSYYFLIDPMNGGYKGLTRDERLELVTRDRITH